MTEQQWDSGREEPGPALAPRESSMVAAGDLRTEDRASFDSPTTRVPAVDAALAEVAGVEALPLAEQLAAFERAHDRLRSALDSEPADPA